MGQANGYGQPGVRLDLLLQPDQLKGRRAAVQPLCAGEVDPGFIQGEGLDEGRQLADRAEYGLAGRDVFAEVRLDDHGLGAGLQRLEHRHCRVHTILAGDVAAGRYHAPFAAANDDGPVPQLRPVTLFDRCVEGVAVQMGDGQLVQLVVADNSARAAGRAPLDASVAGTEAVTADSADGHWSSKAGFIPA